jgi:hypothetical protein
VLFATAGLSLAFAVAVDRLPWPFRALFGLAEKNAARIETVRGQPLRP